MSTTSRLEHAAAKCREAKANPALYSSSSSANTEGGSVTLEDCETILRAADRMLMLPRRDSRNQGEWSAKHGHDMRDAATTATGPAHDTVMPDTAESISDLFLKNKSPDHVKEIKRSIARTASRGGHVRSDDSSVNTSLMREELVKTHLQRQHTRENQIRSF